MTRMTSLIHRTLCALGILCALGVTSLNATGAQAASQRPIRLSMTSVYMSQHPVVRYAWQPWIEEIKKQTRGRLLIEYYNPNTLCPDLELLDAVGKGQVSMGDIVTARNTGRLPINTLISHVPMIASSATAASVAYWNLFASQPEMAAELKGMKVLSVHTSGPVQFWTRDTPVTTLAALEGKQIVGSNKDMTALARGLGLNAIMLPLNDTYLSMMRGMGDGLVNPVPPIRSNKLDEILHQLTIINAPPSTMILCMSEKLWNSLPEDIRVVLEKNTGEHYAYAVGQALDRGEKEDLDLMKKAGLQVNALPEVELVKWREMLGTSLREIWMKAVEGRELKDPQALYNAAITAMSDAEKQYNPDGSAR